MKKVIVIFFSGILIFFVCLTGEVNALTNSKSLYKVQENDGNGIPIYNGQTVSVEGIATVDTGKWHDSSNYFSIVAAKDDYRFSGGVAIYLSGSIQPTISRGARVVVTGTCSYEGYSTDTGTTVIKPSSSSNISIRSAGNELPPAVPIYTDCTYDEVENYLGMRYEGMLVRIMGKIYNYDNEGITRGFYVDGSKDGNYGDQTGKMRVKIYSYSGIDISGFGNGDFVLVKGVLFQSDTTSPYKSGYYIRPTQQSDIKKVDDNTLTLLLDEVRRTNSSGEPVLAGETVNIEGIATVDTGKWHDNSNYFSIISPVPSPGVDPVLPQAGVGVYKYNSLTPTITTGDWVKTTGTVAADGYDVGTTVIEPTSITIQSSGNDLLAASLIRTDWADSELAPYESMRIKVSGKAYNIDNEGITRGFYVDGSSDYNWDNQTGMLRVKFYSYSGIDISNLSSGDKVIVRGVLVENSADGFFIRPCAQADIVKRASYTRRTLFIHLDGFRADYLDRGWDTANIDSIVADGVLMSNAEVWFPTMTTAQMTCLVTGAYPSTHTVPSISMYHKSMDRRLRYLKNNQAETVGETFQENGLLTAAVLQYKLQDRGADIFEVGDTITEITNKAIAVIENDDADFLCVLYNQTDSTAHTYGTNSQEIRACVEAIDDAIGSIVTKLEDMNLYDDTNIYLASDHSMTNVDYNITSDLEDALDSTEIKWEYGAVDIGPFDSDTKIVYTRAGGAAQIYYRQSLTDQEKSTLISALEEVTGIADVLELADLQALHCHEWAGDLVCTCDSGYAFSTSVAEHGSLNERPEFMVLEGPGIKVGETIGTEVYCTDIVPTILHLHNLSEPATVDGTVITDALL